MATQHRAKSIGGVDGPAGKQANVAEASQMKNSFSLAYSIILVLVDFAALVLAFVLAFILRVSLSTVPISQAVPARNYFDIIISALPFWILVFALLGLYNTRVHSNRFSEAARLAVGTIIGMMAIISYSYIANIEIFPARKVVLYALLLAFLLVLISRTILRAIRRLSFAYGMGINRVLLIGDTNQTIALASAMSANNPTGDRVIGVVNGQRHRLEHNTQFMVFNSFDQAVKSLEATPPSTIVQTELYKDSETNNHILAYAQTHHIDYRFVPGNDEMFVGNIDVELFHSVPMIAVHQTALVGWGRVVKRLMDVFATTLILIITSPIFVITALLIKLSDGGPVFLRQARLTRFNQVFKVYKFRSHRREYNGLSPEQAFAKMGKPELIKAYRANGDQLDKDPRVTLIGHFIRKFSIDELPQLINVLKGDLSLVGPRALVPEELDVYARRHTILAVKSGMTGLAQISGRRSISFDERRTLDIYYVQNWSFWSDVIILVKTFWIVVTGRGAN